MEKLGHITQFLGLKRSTAGMLLMVILVGMGEKMAERFLPIYLMALGGGALSIGFLNGLDNLLSALYSFPGGYLSDRLGTKRALFIFNMVAMTGFIIVILIPAWQAVLVGAFFFLSWTAISLVRDPDQYRDGHRAPYLHPGRLFCRPQREKAFRGGHFRVFHLVPVGAPFLPFIYLVGARLYPAGAQGVRGTHQEGHDHGSGTGRPQGGYVRSLLPPARRGGIRGCVRRCIPVASEPFDELPGGLRVRSPWYAGFRFVGRR